MKTKTTALAVTGSLLINLVLGLAITAMFSVAPPVHGAQPEPAHACQGTHSPQARADSSPVRAAPGSSGRPSYVVAARMGWANG